jgi:hypothetical protein
MKRRKKGGMRKSPASPDRGEWPRSGLRRREWRRRQKTVRRRREGMAWGRRKSRAASRGDMAVRRPSRRRVRARATVSRACLRSGGAGRG